jgi:hypothetical protein
MKFGGKMHYFSQLRNLMNFFLLQSKIFKKNHKTNKKIVLEKTK